MLAGGELTKDIVDSLVRIARDGFGTEITDADAKYHILKVGFLQLLYKGKDLVGFASYNKYTFLKNDVLYLSGIVVKKDAQSKGFARFALGEAIREHKSDILAMRTQSALMYHIASIVSEEIFPSVSMAESKNHEFAISLGQHLASLLAMKKYNKKRFMERGTYGTALNSESPTTLDDKANLLFKRLRIERDRGDSVIVVGILPKINGYFDGEGRYYADCDIM